jgi:hypothetical protein
MIDILNTEAALAAHKKWPEGRVYVQSWGGAVDSAHVRKKYRDPVKRKALEAARYQRLKNKAKELGMPIDEVRRLKLHHVKKGKNT